MNAAMRDGLRYDQTLDGQARSQTDAEGEAPGVNGNVCYGERLLWYCRDHGNASPNLPMLCQLRSMLVSHHSDRGDETVAASGDVDDEPVPILTVTQRATQR